MRKIAFKIKDLLAGMVRTLFVVSMFGLGGILTSVLVLIAVVVGIPLIAMFDAFKWREPVVNMLFEYEGAFIQGVAEGLNNIGTRLKD